MEFNVIEKIKNYWNKVTGLTENKPNEEFANATSEHSVGTYNGTDDNDRYLEGMLRQTSKSAKKNIEDTWYDGGYNSNKNIALSHVLFGLTPHYHIDADWRQNVKYEHKLNGRVYYYTPEQEINYLYRKRWQEPYYKKDASLEYMMQCLVKEEVYEPVAILAAALTRLQHGIIENISSVAYLI
jgi:hypothetical protein